MIKNIRLVNDRVKLEAEFTGMDEPQEFSVVAGSSGDNSVIIQSENRLGILSLRTGALHLTAQIQGSICFSDLNGAVKQSDVIESNLCQKICDIGNFNK